MHILSFHIDGFGIFHDAGGEGLSPNLNIFYGHNEAGKSTCLEFFRTMLTGYPEKSGKNANQRTYEPLNGGHPGGSLVLSTREGELYLHRAPSSSGGLSLRTARGQFMHSEDLLRLLGGINREIYSRIFGFSLSELESWDKKHEESFRNALYGATFGPGLVSPAVVLSRLDKEMGKIFKPKGTTSPLNTELNKLNALRQEIRRWEEEYGQYDSICAQLESTFGRLQELKKQREELELKRTGLEARFNVFSQWQQWRRISDRLAQLPPIPAEFPENVPARLAALESDYNTCSRNAAAAAENLRQMEARAAAIRIDGPLLAQLGTLRGLTERKSSYRHAISAIPNLEAEQERLQNELQKSLGMLGANWTCERIAQTDRSLFAREGIERQAAEMNVAKMAHQAAMDGLQRANSASEASRIDMEQASAKLGSLPEPPAVLDGEERDALRSLMNRLDETRRNAPIRQRALDASQHTYQRALAQAGLTENRENCGQILQKLLEHQDQAKELANDINRNLHTAQEAQEQAGRVEREFEGLKKKVAELEQKQAGFSGATREGLGARVAALRSLRGIAPAMAAEKERKKELEYRLAQESASPQLKNWFLLGFGILFLAAAAGIFAAHQFWGINTLELGEGMAIPLNLWAAYAALVCGVVLFGGGYTANSPEKKRRRMEIGQLLKRNEECDMKLAELANQSRQLCAEVGIDSLDPIELDAMEMLLEREKEQVINDERSAREIGEAQMELERASRNLKECAGESRAAELGVQQARKAWHEFMLQLGLVKVPAAESADTLFARLEAASLARENVEHANQELEALWADLHQIEQAITDMPPVKKCLAEAEAPLSLEEAVKTILAQCQEADAIREKRKEYARTLESASEEHEKANTRQKEAYELLEESAARLAEASRAWAGHLTGLGLAEDLNPETVREAFKYMDNCLAIEEKLATVTSGLKEARSELGAMEKPLQKCLEDLQRAPRPGNDNQPDWMAMLDELMALALEQQRAFEKQQDLFQAIENQKGIVATMQAAQEAAKVALQGFLQLGRVDSIDKFVELASLRDEQRALITRKADLEAILSQSARDEDLDTFLKSFAAESEEEMQKNLAQVRKDLEETLRQEQEAATEAGTFKAKAEGLADEDALAALQQDAANGTQICGELANRWSELALAKEIMIQARQIFERERQPAIIQEASRIFAAITGGRWSGLALDLEDASLLALTPGGEAVKPVNLSRGTQEQAYLALRLAYIRQHAVNNETLPVIMDEIMVNFDPVRAERTAKAFAEFASASQQQILYFTCQPHMVELLKKAFVAPALFQVEQGQIIAA